MIHGRVAEWFKAAVLKTVEDESPPRVRISPLPHIKKYSLKRVFFVCLVFVLYYVY